MLDLFLTRPNHFLTFLDNFLIILDHFLTTLGHFLTFMDHFLTFPDHFLTFLDSFLTILTISGMAESLLNSFEQIGTLKPICWTGLDWMGSLNHLTNEKIPNLQNMFDLKAASMLPMVLDL